ncbi:PQQ-binding-like beta-propeller repeat protein [Streptomyces sp. NPDC001941]|uniref:serine/threonine-protein kinase n=1 Tax=Streptomyces sp. NPDC001941 TaxID=3154659 RepID=UPI00332A830E
MLSPLTHDDPERLGGHRPVARLGSGGMGTVYLARTPGGRTVALKTMHAALASDPGFRARFRLETDAARVIGDRHGAAVVDADPLAETPWLATEYVLGPPLDEAVELCGPLPEATVRALGAALAGALGQLHSSDVVHRDLKPSNVMVTAYGPKVIDFGIARAAGDARLTTAGAAAGTPAFMSPEQASGQEHAPAGDVFALAGVLVFALGGRGPFGSGAPADLIYRVRYAEPDLSAVPPALLPLLTRCLDKDPAARPTTAELSAGLHDGHGEFADHLPDLLLAEIARRAAEVWQYQPYRLPAPEGAAAAPTVPVRGGGRAPGRRRLLTLGGGSALGVALAGAGAWAWLGRGEGGKPDPAPKPTGKSGPDLKPYLWQLQVEPSTSSNARPAALSVPRVLGERVLFGLELSMAAIDPSDGTKAWKSEDASYAWRLTTDGSRVHYVREYDGFGVEGMFKPFAIGSLDPATGKDTGRHRTFGDFNVLHDESQLVCCSGDTVYFTGGTGDMTREGYRTSQSWSLVAADLRTGTERWRRPLADRKAGTYAPHFLDGKVVGSRLLLVPQPPEGQRTAVAAHDARTGRQLWSVPAFSGDPGRIRYLLCADDQHVYLGFGPLRALRVTDGKEVWKVEGDFGPPTVRDGVVHAVRDRTGFVAVGAADGRVHWREEGGEGPVADRTDPPVVGARYVYGKAPSGLRQVSKTTHRTVATYRTSATRFVGHPASKAVFGTGGPLIAGYPLE